MKHLFFVIFIITIAVQCSEKKSSAIYDHWLTGTFESDGSDGHVVESWKRPANSHWIGKQKAFLENQVTLEQSFEIEKLEDNLVLLLNYEGREYQLNAVKTDMNGFEFVRDSEEDGPHRVKFEKTSDKTFRRVHYVNINGRNRINMYDFTKISEK